MKKPLVLVFLLACAPTVSSSTVGLSQGELSTVYFYSRNKIELSELSVDGTRQGIFSMGVSVPPGDHYADADFTIKATDCLYDDRYCQDVDYLGHCHASLSTEPGKEYSVEIMAVGDSGFVRVTDKGYGAVVGGGECDTATEKYH